MARAFEMKQKEVINITDGRRLGFVCDVEISLDDGKLEAIVVPGNCKLFRFGGRDSDIVIAWEYIKKIGEDIILVDMDDRFLRRYFDS